MKQTFTTPEDGGVVRVDKYLADLLPEYSRAALAKLFDLNLIKFKGEPIKAGFKLRPGNTVEYDLGPLADKPEVIDLPIIYEDDDVLVVNKPAGIISHARGRFWQEASVASFIRDRISGMDGERGGIVHRLDRATSGVMITAKNEKTLKMLQKQFSDRKTSKIYTAIVSGTPKNSEAIIEVPLGRNPKDPKKFMATAEGKQSTTKYKIIKSGNNHSMLSLEPKTGRTHQLRVHLNYIGNAIVGDELYSGEKANRLMLHASSLVIDIPSRKNAEFNAPLPDELAEFKL